MGKKLQFHQHKKLWGGKKIQSKGNTEMYAFSRIRDNQNVQVRLRQFKENEQQ